MGHDGIVVGCVLRGRFNIFFDLLNVIATDNDGGVGDGESFEDFSLLAGDYFLRIIGGNDEANFYGLELSFTEEETVAVVSAPGAALLFLAGIGSGSMVVAFAYRCYGSWNGRCRHECYA